MSQQLYTIPISQRPPHGSLATKILFPLLFNLGQLGIHAAQLASLPLLLIPIVGKVWFERAIAWTKDGYGRLLILITVLFAPTTLVLTSDTDLDLVERDAQGQMIKINLPDQLVIMANHQAYTDWMYIWILACYAGYARGLIILLKAALKHVPIVGWGMRFFHFIFLHRNWASDRENLTMALKQLGRSDSPLWLLIFPEGTITSDEERAKSRVYAEKEGVPDFVTMLHPRATGLLFCIRALLPEVPNLQLLDMTIGYPGVPYGKYPQDWYGLMSVFFRSVPPPTVHIHLRLYSDLTSIPSVVARDKSVVADSDEARAFNLWLRGVWEEKERRMEAFARNQEFPGRLLEVVPIRQLKWYHWIAAFGGGGVGALVVALLGTK